jgi:predicted TIM-barrel fold metal-dependent hydrolase
LSAAFSRRTLLAGLGSAGLAATLPAGGLGAATGGFIDVHHHQYPPRLLAAAKAEAARTGVPLAPYVRDWSPQRSLEVMDANGIATSVLVLAQSDGVWDLRDPAGMRRMARACNEHGAEMVRAHPGRYAFFAWLPMPDVEGGLAEIAYALDHLGASGIGFFTSYDKQWVGDPAFRPVWDELDRRGAVAYFHPLAATPCCANLVAPVRDNYIEFPQDTARAVMSLLFNGVLATHRNVKWIFSHAGGPVPVYAHRVATLSAARPDIAKVAPDGVMAELGRLNFETANAAYAPSMDALLDIVPLSHVVFGTDFPYVSCEENLKSFGALKLAADARAAITRENALRMIPRLPGGK